MQAWSYQSNLCAVLIDTLIIAQKITKVNSYI